MPSTARSLSPGFTRTWFLTVSLVTLLWLGTTSVAPLLAQEGGTEGGPDFGDAPDGHPARYTGAASNVTGSFPTRLNTTNSRVGAPGAFVHESGIAWLGPLTILPSTEEDAEIAQGQFDEDVIENFIDDDFYDDGLVGWPCPESPGDLEGAPFPGEEIPAFLAFDVSLSDGAQDGPWYLNVLVDLDRDGEWRGADWVVQDLELFLNPGTTTRIQTPVFSYLLGPNAAWTRVALTSEEAMQYVVDSDGWDGSGEFQQGEIEDYLLASFLDRAAAAAQAAAGASASAEAVAAAAAEADERSADIEGIDLSIHLNSIQVSFSQAQAAVAAAASARDQALELEAEAALACAAAGTAVVTFSGVCASCPCASACGLAFSAAQSVAAACGFALAAASASASAAADAFAFAQARADAIAIAQASALAEASAFAIAVADASSRSLALSSASSDATSFAGASSSASTLALGHACGGAIEELVLAFADAQANAQATANASASAFASATAHASAWADARVSARVVAQVATFAATDASAAAFAAAQAQAHADAAAQAEAAAGAASASLSLAVSAASASCSGDCCDKVVVSEVMFNPQGADKQLEWVELFNPGPTTADLSRYTLGAGGSAYTDTLVKLSGVLEPGQTYVVGGPLSSADNGFPFFDLGASFLPEIENGGAVADGLALFKRPIDDVTKELVPLDAVLWGLDNSNKLLDSDGQPAVPAVSEVPEGWSLERHPDLTWQLQAAPSPNFTLLEAGGDCQEPSASALTLRRPGTR